MIPYFLVKYFHVLSAVVILGADTGTAFVKLMTCDRAVVRHHADAE